jgi:hypothetical protein
MSDDSILPQLKGQYVLCRDRRLVPGSWSVRRGGSWLLATHPSLPAITLETEEKRVLGWLVGYPVDGDTMVASAAIRVKPGEEEGFAERSVATLSGRYVLILAGRTNRVYLDPAGSLPAVFSEKAGAVASSVTLLGPAADEEERELTAALGMPHSDRYYPFGLMPRKHTKALLPNHRLDLSSWRTERYWPDFTRLPAVSDTRDAVAEAAAIISGNIRAATESFGGSMAVTAGKDSRVLLACSRDLLPRLRFFTLYERGGSLDCHTAGLLARGFDLPHEFIQVRRPPEAFLGGFLFRTGYRVSTVKGKVNFSLSSLEKKRILLTGMVGPVCGGSTYWRGRDRGGPRPGPEELVRRLKLPRHDAVIESAAAWLRDVPDVERTETLIDLAELENIVGCWASPQTLGDVDFSSWNMWPFSHRRLFELGLGLSWEYKMGAGFHRDICLFAWPELMRYPFNRFSGPKALYNVKAAVGAAVRRRI